MSLGKKTGGRKKGVPNQRTELRKKQLERGGISPLDYMLSVMRDQENELSVRTDMAKAAAPYVHPRLQSSEVTGKDGGPLALSVAVSFIQPGAKNETDK